MTPSQDIENKNSFAEQVGVVVIAVVALTLAGVFLGAGVVSVQYFFPPESSLCFSTVKAENGELYKLIGKTEPTLFAHKCL
jgi:hypothetical protein